MPNTAMSQHSSTSTSTSTKAAQRHFPCSNYELTPTAPTTVTAHSSTNATLHIACGF